jgi:hypothetical protein
MMLDVDLVGSGGAARRVALTLKLRSRSRSWTVPGADRRGGHTTVMSSDAGPPVLATAAVMRSRQLCERVRSGLYLFLRVRQP